MKLHSRILLIAGIIGFCSLISAQDISKGSLRPGTWRWKFIMPDGTETRPSLRLKRNGDQLVGTTKFRPNAETAVTNLTISGDQIAFDVIRERNGQPIKTRYEGLAEGDKIKGKIISNWSGTEQSYPWEARRAADVEGTWKWSNSFGNFQFTSTAELKQEGEKVTGKILSRRGSDTEIKEGSFKDSKISFNTERERDGEKFVTKYRGKISGDTITGTIRTTYRGEPRTNEWTATRED